jgi:hypothetical protein
MPSDLAVLLDHADHLSVRDGVALARHIVVPTGTGLLAKAAFFAQQIRGLAVFHVGFSSV